MSEEVEVTDASGGGVRAWTDAVLATPAEVLVRRLREQQTRAALLPGGFLPVHTGAFGDLANYIEHHCAAPTHRDEGRDG